MQPGVYVTPTLPLAWVVVDNEGAAWIVPTTADGWAQRKPYRGHTTGLQPVALGLALGVQLSAGLPSDLVIVTPAEAAVLTGTSESGWRNRAAAGKIPGAFLKGKQWLIPRSAVIEAARPESP